ncbi:zinc-finger domain-containing protein [Sulfurisphaera tokodaii]
MWEYLKKFNYVHNFTKYYVPFLIDITPLIYIYCLQCFLNEHYRYTYMKLHIIGKTRIIVKTK